VSRAAPLPVSDLSAAARRALVALDAEPVAAGVAEFLYGHEPLEELKAAGRAFCDCKRGGALTEWKGTNWWIASNDRARGGARARGGGPGGRLLGLGGRGFAGGHAPGRGPVGLG
jgi:hypothetical protein